MFSLFLFNAAPCYQFLPLKRKLMQPLTTLVKGVKGCPCLTQGRRLLWLSVLLFIELIKLKNMKVVVAEGLSDRGAFNE